MTRAITRTRKNAEPGLSADPARAVSWRRAGATGYGLRTHRTVLVVDEEPLLREATAQLLRRFGYEVLEAPGPLEARRMAPHYSKIDLLFTEYSLLETDGLALVRWCHDQCPQMKALIATDSVWELLYHASNEEYFAVLAKPFTEQELDRMLREILR